MEILITSKTQWGERACIGGVEIGTGRFVRLMTSTGEYQPLNSPFSIGDIWNLTYEYKAASPPHVEDVYLISRTFVRREQNFKNFILENFEIWNGDYNTIFEGTLSWTSGGSGFLHKKSVLPSNSVGFWICDRDLTWDGTKYYTYKQKTIFRNKKIPYKGFLNPIPTISTGTLIRLSLAKWWPANDPRCYLQLSGWYE